MSRDEKCVINEGPARKFGRDSFGGFPRTKADSWKSRDRRF